MKAEQPLDSEAESQEQLNGSFEQVSINSFSFGSRHQFFEGGDRGQILDVLPLLQMEGKNCVVIEGETGMGKTVLAQQIFTQSQNAGFSSVQVVSHDLASEDEHEIYRHLGSYFKMTDEEISSIDSGEKLSMLALSRVQAKLVLVIDDAHQLSAKAIALFVEFLKAAPRSKIQVIFLAQPSAAVLMADFGLQDYLADCGHQISLRPFNSKETSDYVRFLLIATEKEGVKLSPQLLGKIYQSSAGIPSKINERLVDALHEHEHIPVTEGKQRSEIVPKWHLVSLSLVAVGVIALIVFGNPEKSAEPRFSETVRSMPEEEEAADYNNSPPIRFTDAQAPERLAADSAYQGSSQSADDNLSGSAGLRGTNTTENYNQQPQNRYVDSSNSRNSYEKKSEYTTAMTDEYDGGNSYTSRNTQTAQTLNKPEPASVEPQPVRQKEPETLEEPAKVSMADKLAKLKAEKPVPAQSAASVSATQTASNDTGWIKGMPGSHYTLQLLGGANKQSIQKFIDQNGNYRKMGYFETRHQGQPWYVVVYGDFPSKAQAIAAADQLPGTLVSSKPWPRSAADIQSSMY